MSWLNLKTDIVTLLESISGIHQVITNTGTRFSGYPAVTVTQSALESETKTNRENLRTYNFDLNIFYDASNGVDEARSKVEQTVDTIVNKIDQEERNGQSRTIGSSLGTDYQILDVVPIIGAWDYLETNNVVVSQLTLQVRLTYFVET